MKTFFISLLSTLILFSCSNSQQKENADLFIYNATIYTVDSVFTYTDAMLIKDGRILATGTKAELQFNYTYTDSLDAQGKFIYPGLIDAHAHFYGYGTSLQRVDLTGTNSWDEIIERTKNFAAQNPEGWILGRGWDQNDWTIQEFPDNIKLSEVFPDRPVLLTRVDGHAAIANKKALELAAVTPQSSVTGGMFETKNGQLTGILVDNAIDLVTSRIPAPSTDQVKKALQAAEKNCYAMGLTTIVDCGLGNKTVDLIRQLHDSNELKMRLYVMLSDETSNYDYLERTGIIKTPRLHVRGFKIYGDGALGSRGACLLKPYSDKPGHVGFLLSAPGHFDSVAKRISSKNFQMCSHAIGDSGNRTLLNIYAKYLQGPNDKRWRIEHAQVVDTNDIAMFGKYSIIPSVQPTHATSDMYWAEARVGKARMKGAYAFNDLRKQNGWLPLGTDFPVEDISPFKTFYAAVFRKDAKGWPEKGFQPENALTREDALRGMTIWAAKASFEENEKGSLERGKLADFIILDKDLMKAPENEILQIKVISTYVDGKPVYSINN